MSNESMYTVKEYPQSELDRLTTFSYPEVVTQEVFGNFELAGKTVLNVGAGPNPTFGQYIESLSGKIVVVDINPSVVQKQLSSLSPKAEGFQANILQLPFSDQTYDIVFERFVLIHQSTNDQKLAFSEMLRVAKEQVVMIEFDWSTLDANHSRSRSIVNEFLTLTGKLFEILHGDINAGSQIIELAESANSKQWDVHIHRAQRPEADYTQEIIMLSRSSIEVVQRNSKVKVKSLATQFERLIQKLEQQSIEFIPPDIVVVSLKRDTS